MISLMEKQKRKPRPDVVLRNKSRKQREAVSRSHQSGNRDDVYAKISMANKKSMLGNRNRWLGDSAGYSAIHKWVAKEFGCPSKCEQCGKTDKKKYEWCSLDGEYSRNREDWARMCTSCHRQYDYQNGVTASKFRLP